MLGLWLNAGSGEQHAALWLIQLGLCHPAGTYLFHAWKAPSLGVCLRRRMLSVNSMRAVLQGGGSRAHKCRVAENTLYNNNAAKHVLLSNGQVLWQKDWRGRAASAKLLLLHHGPAWHHWIQPGGTTLTHLYSSARVRKAESRRCLTSVSWVTSGLLGKEPSRS